MLNGLFGNWRTTVLGIATGILTYLLAAGTHFPANKTEWGAFAAGLLQAAWGAVQKDSATGSKAPS